MSRRGSALLHRRATPVCDLDRLARLANCSRQWAPPYRRTQFSRTKRLACLGCSGMPATFLKRDAERQSTPFSLPLPGVVLSMRSSPSRSSKVNFAPKKVPVLIFRSVGMESSFGAGSALPVETSEIAANQASQNRQLVAEKGLGMICMLRYKDSAPRELLRSRMSRSSWLPAQSSPAELEQRKALRREQSEFGRELRRTEICFRKLPRNDEGLVFQVSCALRICK